MTRGYSSGALGYDHVRKVAIVYYSASTITLNASNASAPPLVPFQTSAFYHRRYSKTNKKQQHMSRTHLS